MSGKGRLSISTVLSSKNTSFDSSFGDRSGSSSATISYAEREVKKLKEENSKLRREIKEVRSLYNQLVQENTHEKFDERRITLIKSQVIQLERQILLMSEAISSRSETLAEVENSLTWLADQWRQYIAVDTRTPEVPIKRSDLTLMVETAESARIKLYKNIENMTVRNLSRPLMFVNDFVKPGYEGELTLLDIASGQLEHINLKHVAKLETKLASLYKELISFHSLLEDSDSPSLHPVSQHTNKALQDRVTTKLLKSCAMMKDCCNDLVQLSLLYPSAPWPPLKKSALKDITNEQVMKSLPPLPKSKTKDVNCVIEALLKAVNYKNTLMNHEIKSLKEDLKFHKSVYDLQLQYIEELFNAVKDGYKKFEESTKDVIVKPLQDILTTYVDLKDTASEKALKEFLSCFKDKSEKLENAVEQLSVTQEESGSDALSQFGEDFFYSLDKLVNKCRKNRDRAVKQRSDLKNEQEKLEQELRSCLDEQELKYKEFFLETDRTNTEENTSSRLSDNSPEKEKGSNFKQYDTHKPSVSPIEELKETKSKSVNEKRSSKVDKFQNKQTKWNDDISVPPTFDNMDFIYKTDPETCQGDIENGDNDNNESLTGRDTLLSCQDINSEQNTVDKLPPVSQVRQLKRTKPKRNYTPNLVVANRTLQLRRSNSSSKINDMTENLERLELKSDTQNQEETANKHLRSRSRSRERNPVIPHKPPFK